ncbi:penicillin acylase family protein [Stenotrophomonas sp. MMGLT7]|uniref:penicillin acylase family protein n=1 Tax=Stenotrophomonas sp. MMGLT7 TaxID=2901227 RepID=UPI001E5782BA|nr:penicillin acylase family protein [Stenotrophomonas sp. MMGLT7]MCD7098985.1 penicillin acylase family protein [Stenotrophomonas sp. MMGLT7]
MLKWMRRALAALAIVLLLAAAGAWALLRGSLPPLQGEQALPGLSAPARIDRDARGMVTIEAANAVDAARALGYVHAQERYFEMDLARRSAAGELAGLFGPAALELDRANRIHRMRARASANLAGFAGARMQELQAYSDGVNAGLAALRVRPWPYLLLRRAPAPWRPEDSALAGYAMYFDLQDAGNRRELALDALRRALPPALFELLAHDGSSWDAPLQGPVRGDAVLPGADEVDLRKAAVSEGEETGRDAGALALTPPPASQAVPLSAAQRERDVGGPPAAAGFYPGSNNWAVAGTLTADRRAIVADDMHLSLRAPGLWFRARLRYPDASAAGGRVDVAGFTLPGLPAVIVGSNGHIAWGFTNSYADTADAFRVHPCAAGTNASAACDAVRVHRETIEVAGAAAQALLVEDTGYGPIVRHDADGSALALRWVAHQPGALNLGLAGFAGAGSLQQAFALADDIATPAQNLVLGDAGGRIGWRVLGPLPQRAPPCSDGSRIHDARDCPPWPISTRISPQLLDPADGRLWTANNRIVDGQALAVLGDGGYALGARARQIRDGLRSRERFDEHALLAIQLDDRALFLQRWWALLQQQARRAGAAQPALQALARRAGHWDGRASIDSASYLIVRQWRRAVNERIAAGLLAPARDALGERMPMPRLSQLEGVAWPLLQQQPAHLLPPGHASWPALLDAAAAQVLAELDVDGKPRGWGTHNTASICHPLAQALPAVARRWLCMPADPLPGDTDMPRVQAPAFGASQRMVVAPGHEADGIAHMPGGQSGHPLSPYWGAGHEDWVRGRPTPLLPGAAQHTLVLRPAD